MTAAGSQAQRTAPCRTRSAALARLGRARRDGRSCGSPPRSASASRACRRSPSSTGSRRPSPELARLRAEAEATSATALRQVNPLDRAGAQRRDPDRRAGQSGRAAFPSRRQRCGPGPLARLPDRRHLLRGGDRAHRRPARRRPGGAEPGPPSGLSQFGLRRRLRRRAPRHRLPVQLRLRRLAAPRAGRILSGSGRAAVAAAALNGYVYAPVGWATHYHANYVMPYWAPTLVKSANVGLHIFYRWRGGWGRPDAFTNAYSGAEPAIAWRGGFGQPIGGVGRRSQAAAMPRPRQAAAAAGVERQRRQLPARGAAPLRAAAAGHAPAR